MPKNTDEPDRDHQDGGGGGISDDQLPDDVRPGDDNPLAKGPLDDDEEEPTVDLQGMDQPGA